jgi:hypothetical protein
VHLFEDVGGFGGPDERLGVVVVLSKIGVDGDFEVFDASEYATANALAGVPPAVSETSLRSLSGERRL